MHLFLDSKKAKKYLFDIMALILPPELYDFPEKFWLLELQVLWITLEIQPILRLLGSHFSIVIIFTNIYIYLAINFESKFSLYYL